MWKKENKSIYSITVIPLCDKQFDTNLWCLAFVSAGLCEKRIQRTRLKRMINLGDSKYFIRHSRRNCHWILTAAKTGMPTRNYIRAGPALKLKSLSDTSVYTPKKKPIVDEIYQLTSFCRDFPGRKLIWFAVFINVCLLSTVTMDKFLISLFTQRVINKFIIIIYSLKNSSSYLPVVKSWY